MTRLSIIGDHFMLPEMFRSAIEAACPARPEMTLHTLPWPDEPMEHGYAVAGMDGLKEYQGSAEATIAMIGEAEMLVTHLAPLSRQMLEKLPKLKFVAVSRGGPVNVDMAAAREAGVRVVNTPGRNASAVAEFTLGAIIAETRNITRGHDALRQKDWRGDLYRADRTGRELSEMTVGVVGYGAIGTRVVKLLRAFGCQVLVADPYVQLSREDRDASVEHVGFDDLLTRSDVVTLHCRVSEETTAIMNADAFARMKPDATFINTARGPLVDYDALTATLQAGHLRGAMLETFAVEPVPADWPLLALPNVTLTPHIAGASVKTVSYAAEKAAEEVRRFLAGEPPVNPC
ncbi:2-hydroxyacid dehydrogenase [Jiella sp. MQZ9-1]|uniref:2-hydroxyacid dehydrogenase n=1 Tax=Jiella flava TaxID=2816857 RepID=A0A939FXL7_9HYPH|nr:2-hydroxyacid dehydrogenase [Jiella flava]MBO0662081.1 2-hydroxyacid dehydrogenase [Jiella flava]MCD2470591.1 2-hydroxyacid dehydrogenase [Jiella flava]